jgi:hypothetical protein
MRLFPPLGILQNNTTSMIIDNPPLFDLLQRSEATETSEVIVEAAISDARRLSGAVGITHLHRAQLRGSEFDHTGGGKSGHPSQG